MNNFKSIVTVNYRLDQAKRFIRSFATRRYYLFAGNHIDPSVVQPYDNQQDTILRAYYNMLFGKRLYSTDCMSVARRIDWQSGIVYDMYDHRTPNLYDTDFYVAVLEGDQYDVFKCLENGGGVPSTVAPSRNNVSSSNSDFYYPNDGYRWKYLYSISSAEFDKFANRDFIPVKNDAGVQAYAFNGAIDVIKVEDGGSGYSNYLYGAFGVSDIRLNGDPTIYGISTTGAKSVNGFYKDCYLYISSGPGSGQYRLIIDYISNSQKNYIQLESPFDINNQPENASQFEITPAVKIYGDGSQTATASARALINTAANTVSRIEMIEHGQNYNLASAVVLASNVVGVTANSLVTPIYSPYGGHGSDAQTELGATSVCVSGTFSKNEGNTIVSGNDYAQLGIIRDPHYKKLTLSLSNNTKDFTVPEYVYKINPTQLQGVATTTLNANNELTTQLNITGVDDVNNILKSGDTVFFDYNSQYMLANVVTVSNSSIIIDKTALFTTATGGANVHIANVTSSGYVSGFSSGVVYLTDATADFYSGDTIIGGDTGTYSQISSFKISDTTKSYNTFSQVYKYVGTQLSGILQNDETVYQTALSVAHARFHSTELINNKKYYNFTNQVGIFNTLSDGSNTTDEIIGQTSGAIARLTNKYIPDLVFGSGYIVYLENGDSITRSSENSESFKLIFQF